MKIVLFHAVPQQKIEKPHARLITQEISKDPGDLLLSILRSFALHLRQKSLFLRMGQRSRLFVEKFF